MQKLIIALAITLLLFGSFISADPSFLDERAETQTMADTAILVNIGEMMSATLQNIATGPYLREEAVDDAIKAAFNPIFEQCGKINNTKLLAACVEQVKKEMGQAVDLCKEDVEKKVPDNAKKISSALAAAKAKHFAALASKAAQLAARHASGGIDDCSPDTKSCPVCVDPKSGKPVDDAQLLVVAKTNATKAISSKKKAKTVKDNKKSRSVSKKDFDKIAEENCMQKDKLEVEYCRICKRKCDASACAKNDEKCNDAVDKCKQDKLDIHCPTEKELQLKANQAAKEAARVAKAKAEKKAEKKAAKQAAIEAKKADEGRQDVAVVKFNQCKQQRRVCLKQAQQCAISKGVDISKQSKSSAAAPVKCESCSNKKCQTCKQQCKKGDKKCFAELKQCVADAKKCKADAAACKVKRDQCELDNAKNAANQAKLAAAGIICSKGDTSCEKKKADAEKKAKELEKKVGKVSKVVSKDQKKAAKAQAKADKADGKAKAAGKKFEKDEQKKGAITKAKSSCARCKVNKKCRKDDFECNAPYKQCLAQRKKCVDSAVKLAASSVKECAQGDVKCLEKRKQAAKKLQCPACPVCKKGDGKCDAANVICNQHRKSCLKCSQTCDANACKSLKGGAHKKCQAEVTACIENKKALKCKN